MILAAPSCQLITMEPDRQEAIELIERADLLLIDGDSPEARELLEKALEVDPLNAEAKRLLMGMDTRAALARGQAEPQVVKSPEIQEVITLARQAIEDSQYELAERLLRRGLSIDPDDAEILSLISTTQAFRSRSGLFHSGI